MAHIELDEGIIKASRTWREKSYERTSSVTRRLFEFWFEEEHVLPEVSVPRGGTQAGGSRFGFYGAGMARR